MKTKMTSVKDYIVDKFYNSTTLRLMNLILLILMFIDTFLTIRGLALGFGERNILLNFIFEHLGLGHVLLFKVLVSIIIFFVIDFILFSMDNYDIEPSFKIFLFMMFNYLLFFQIILYMIAVFVNISILNLFEGVILIWK